MGFVARKPVFGVSDKARGKPVSSATETSKKIENLLDASLDTIISSKQIIKVLIRLHGCTGWSAPVLFIYPGDRFSPFFLAYQHISTIIINAKTIHLASHICHTKAVQ